MKKYFKKLCGVTNNLIRRAWEQKNCWLDSLWLRKKKHDLINPLSPKWNGLYESIL